MPEKIPLVIRVNVPQTGFNPDAVDAEIFCVNTTETIFSILTKRESFTTVDEETGHAAEHGSDPEKISLAPSESAKIAEVQGWEWDGHVGINILFRSPENKKALIKSYNFKESTSDFNIPSTGKTGRIIPPLK